MTGDDRSASLRKLIAEVERTNDVSALSALTLLKQDLEVIEHELVAEARGKGATWQQIADELGAADRQWAQGRFSHKSAPPLPGMSAAAMARQLKIHPQTVAAHPDKYGVIVRVYPDASSKRPRKRYFLPGDEG